MKKFILVDGYISMDNSQLFIDINNFKKDLKNRGGWLGLFFTLIGISVFNNFRNEKYFEKVFHYLDFGFRIIGMLTIIIVFYYVFFMRKSSRKLFINEITKVEIEKGEFETEIVLNFSNKRSKDITFRNLENQIEPFLETLKKRNSRIEFITL